VKGILLIPALLVLALLWVAVDEEAGIRPWLHLRGELDDARGRIEALRSDVERLDAQAVALDDRGFDLERAIREELDLVGPGQTLIRMGGNGVTSARIP
jgi:hypothetical protein